MKRSFQDEVASSSNSAFISQSNNVEKLPAKNEALNEIGSFDGTSRGIESTHSSEQLESVAKLNPSWVDRYRDYIFPKRSNSNDAELLESLDNGTDNHHQSFRSTSEPAPITNMRQPTNIVIGLDGSRYIAETFNHVIRKIAPGGETSTFVGLNGQSGGMDGQGTDARLHHPTCLCMDSKGRIFVADSGNELIRMVTQDGLVTTVAGTMGLPGHVDGKTNVHFCCPIGIICDEFDRLYVADAGNHCIRVITFDDSLGLIPNNDTAEQASAVRPASPSNSQRDKSPSVSVGDSIEPGSAPTTSEQFARQGELGRSLEVTTLLFQQADEASWPSALMVDATSNVFILDKSSGHMSRITSDGTLVGDFEDYGDESVDQAVQGDKKEADGSGFVFDNVGYLAGGMDNTPRAYVIEKMDKKLLERYRQGSIDSKDLDALLRRPEGSSHGKPVQAYVMMSMPLDEEGNPVKEPEGTAPNKPTASC